MAKHLRLLCTVDAVQKLRCRTIGSISQPQQIWGKETAKSFLRVEEIISGEVWCVLTLSVISDLPGNSPSINIQVLLLGVERVK